MKERPKIGVAALVARDGKILMMHRRGSHGEGSWSVPGGHLENGEEPEQTAEREVQEETGLQVSDWKNLGFTNDIFDGVDTGKHYITLWYAGKAEDESEPKNIEPEKCQAMEWFELDNLPKPLFKSWERVLGGAIENGIRKFLEDK